MKSELAQFGPADVAIQGDVVGEAVDALGASGAFDVDGGLGGHDGFVLQGEVGGRVSGLLSGLRGRWDRR